MFKRWRHTSKEDVEREPPVPPSPPDEEISLPDPREAREALTHSLESKRKSDELSRDVREMLRHIRAAREENNFAEGIVQMIKEGR
jgi:hypothetical protein